MLNELNSFLYFIKQSYNIFDVKYFTKYIYSSSYLAYVFNKYILVYSEHENIF